jgi:ElaB/YqjD/DUF883 family membrane-anchored ribosome-binding protein
MTNVEQAAVGGVSGSDQSTAEQAKERVAESAQQVGEKAQEMRSQAGERVREQLDTRSTQAGEQMTTTAEAVRRVGEQLRSEGNPGPARYADQVADRAERLGRYLTQSDADKLLRDVEDFARRQPWLAVVGGATIGFLASRFVKASSVNRYRQSYSGNGRYELPSGDPGTASMGQGAAESPSRQPGRSGGRGDL